LACLLDFRDSYYARRGLFDHLNSNGFDCRSGRLFHFPCDFLRWRTFGLGPGSRSLRRFRSLGQRDYEDRLPRWKGVSHLTPEANASYQEAAKQIAKASSICRVHLDMKYWRAKPNARK
jgi:hypothetical protein